jgi:hypothetical protein
MIGRATLASLLVLAGCAKAPGNVVDVTLVVDGTVPASVLQTVRSLTLATTGVDAAMKTYALPTGMPKQETVQLLPTVTSGTLTLTATAYDKNQLPLAQGMKSVQLTGKEVPLAVTLSMVAPPTLTVTPGMVTITVGKTASFMASLPVTWSVMGGAGNGTVDANGVYTAPMTAGTYTLVATAKIDPAVTTSATITVAAYGLELLAGQLGGMGEYNGVGGAARLSSPAALASDNNGTLYVGSRFYTCVLHKIDLATQTMTVIGGKPFECSDVDGKLGSTALFNGMWSLAYDPVNNVLFVGEYNVIRRVALTSGDVTTLNDGMGHVIYFNGRIAGMAYDPASKILYASNDRTHIINAISLAGAAPSVSVFAGMQGTPGSFDAAAGPATMSNFNGPSGLAFDGTNLFVADYKNSTIRKIVVASGATSTLAGTAGMQMHTDGTGPSARFVQPFGVALPNNNGPLFVTEDNGSTVRAVATSNGSTVTVAGSPPKPPGPGMPSTPGAPVDGAGGAAVFGPLAGIAFDQQTNLLYVGDFRLGLVRSVVPAGSYVVSTTVGTPAALGYADGTRTAARFWSIGSLTSDGNTVYLADNGNAVIRKADITTGAVTTIAGKAGFYGGDDGDALTMARFERPEGVFIDGKILYISDGSGSTIRALDLSTNLVTTIAGKHLETGTTDGIGSAARLGYPLFITGDHNGKLFVADSIPGVRQLTIATGELKTVAGSPTDSGYVDDVGPAARFSGLYGMAVENGALYICDSGPGVFNGLRKMTLDTFTVSTAAGGPTIGLTDGVGTAAQFLVTAAANGDGMGHIYVGDAGALRRFDVATGMVSTVLGKAFQITDLPGPLDTALLGSVNGAAVVTGGDVVVDDAFEDVLLLARLPSP